MFGLFTVIALLLTCMTVVSSSAQTEPTISFTAAVSSPILHPVSSTPTQSEIDSFKALVMTTASPPFYAIARDHPDITCWLTSMKITPQYRPTVKQGTKLYFELFGIEYGLFRHDNYTDPKGMTEALQEKVNSFVPQGDTLYDKLISIHDYVTSSTTYLSDTDGALYCYSAYGSLVDGKSVCEGYAEAFKLLCDKNGIDCVLVTGNAATEDGFGAHMWNYVLMDDGNWYAVDATWDDAGDLTGRYGYFLIGSSTVVNGTPFAESHIPTYDFSGMDIAGFEYPELSENAYDKECDKTEYSYGNGGSYYYDRLTDVQKELYDALYSQLVSNTPSGGNTDTTEPDTSDSSESESSSDSDVTEPEETTDDSSSESGSDSSSPDSTESNEGSSSADSTESDSLPDSTVPDSTEPDSTEPDSTDEETTPDESGTSDSGTSESDSESSVPDSTDESSEKSTDPDETTPDADTTATDTPDSSDNYDSTAEDSTVSDSITSIQSPTSTESESVTVTEPDNTESITDTSITTDPIGNMTDTETDSSDVSQIVATESVTTSTPDSTEKKDKGFSISSQLLYDIINVTVIVCAIICLSLILGVVIVKFSKGYDNDD